MMLHNPVLRGFHPDPSVCRVGEDYFLACSSFGYAPGVPIFHSRDLASWRLVGHALGMPLLRAGSEGIFAPTLRHHDGHYYLVTTNVGNGGNFLLTAEDPSGPWSEPVWIDNPWFDPSLLFDGDGKVYYTRRGGETAIVQAEIDVTDGRLLTPLREIADGFVSPDCEGPHLYRIGDWYYLVMAEGGSRTGHMVTVGRSRSPWGPFSGCPQNPVLTNRNLTNNPVRSVGHADLFEARDGSWWAACHGTRHDTYETFSLLGRETFLVPVVWDADGWPVFNGGQALDLTPVTLPWSGDRWPLREGVSSQIEYAVPGPDSSARFRGLRVAGFRERFSARMVVPETGSCGIALFMNWRHRYDVILERSEGGAQVRMRCQLGDIISSEEPVAINGAEAELALDFSLAHATFSVRSPGGAPLHAGSADPRYLSPEVSGTWTGLVAGVFVEGGAQMNSEIVST